MDNTSMLVNVSEFMMNNGLAAQASSLMTFFQAIGGLIIAYIIFNLISLWLGRRKNKEISKMRETLERIDKRLAKLEKKKR